MKKTYAKTFVELPLTLMYTLTCLCISTQVLHLLHFSDRQHYILFLPGFVWVSALSCLPENFLHEGKSLLADVPHQIHQKATTPHGKDLPRKECDSGSVGYERGCDDWKGQGISLGKRRWNLKWEAVSSDFGLSIFYSILSWSPTIFKVQMKNSNIDSHFEAIRSHSGQASSSQLDYTMP